MVKTLQFTYCGVTIEWDPAKAISNLAKHGIAFENACEVFFDPFLRVVDVAKIEEARDAVIGYTESQKLLSVVHVVRHEDAIRIISARLASKEERRIHESL